MNKELEALNKIQHDFGQLKGQELVNCFETIFNGLKRLESIDNANPSEALECLDKMAKQIELDEDTDYWEIRNAHKTVENALQKAQEQEKVLEIIKENPSIVMAVKRYSTYDNFKANNMNSNITEEEFNLLKRWSECQSE